MSWLVPSIAAASPVDPVPGGLSTRLNGRSLVADHRTTTTTPTLPITTKRTPPAKFPGISGGKNQQPAAAVYTASHRCIYV